MFLFKKRSSVILLFCSIFLFYKCHAQNDLQSILYPIIEKEIIVAKLELDKNVMSNKRQIEHVKLFIEKIWTDIKKEGFSESIGKDEDLRPAYVIMQGIIERAQIVAHNEKKIANNKWAIVTPRMPTPLIFEKCELLSNINIAYPLDLAAYRRCILIDFLKSEGKLYDFYAKDAREVIKDKQIIIRYDSLLAEYSTLIDRPNLDVSMNDFPVKMGGAIYLMRGIPFIAVESYQVGSSLGPEDINKWAIRFGDGAIQRGKQMKDFFPQLSEIIK